MANSLSFNNIDLGQYGLTIASRSIPMEFRSEGIQLQDKAYASDSLAVPKVITLAVTILGTSLATLKANMDSVKAVLDKRADSRLDLDSLTDRYWMARFQSLVGQVRGFVFSGTLTFTAYDSFAYDVDETTHTYLAEDFAEDPETFVVPVLGTTRTEPVYTLTAGEQLADATILLRNAGIDMELSWGPDTVVNSKKLVIDVPNWLVTNDGDASMATVSGQFPYLNPGNNSIRITGFGLLGSMTIVYRKRYL